MNPTLPSPPDPEHLRAAALGDEDFVAHVFWLAFGRGWNAPRPRLALALLRGRPGLAASSLPLALVQGDVDGVKRLLARARSPAPPSPCPPLACAAASSLARLPECRADLVATVRWLLDTGADANGTWRETGDAGQGLPVLYGAVARARCLETVQALLDAGANPNDNESLYHATELGDRRIVAALVAAGARWSGTNALARQLDHDDLEGLRQCLQLGADPNEPAPDGGNALHHAVRRGRGVAFLRLLVDHGTDPLARDAQGRRPAWHALHSGDTAALEFLASLGAGVSAQGVEVLLAACAAGDEAAARHYLAGHPGAIGALDPCALRLLPDQAQRGRIDSVGLMLALGWPVDVRGDWQASAFNQAAFRGDAALCRLLAARGAHWSEPNGYGGDVLGSCLHAGLNQPTPGGDYLAVARLLAAQGAPLTAEHLHALAQRAGEG